jgi:hypothetical protein
MLLRKAEGSRMLENRTLLLRQDSQDTLFHYNNAATLRKSTEGLQEARVVLSGLVNGDIYNVLGCSHSEVYWNTKSRAYMQPSVRRQSM